MQLEQNFSEEDFFAIPEETSVFIIIGEKPINDYMSLTNTTVLTKDNAHIRLFNTVDEKKAYLQALQDVTSYEYWYVISKKEFYRLFHPDADTSALALKKTNNLLGGIDPIMEGSISVFKKIETPDKKDIIWQSVECTVPVSTAKGTTSKDIYYIKDLYGKTITVTDLKSAIKQAENCCDMHEECKIAKDAGHNQIYFQDAHKEWIHILNELKKIKENAAQ